MKRRSVDHFLATVPVSGVKRRQADNRIVVELLDVVNASLSGRSANLSDRDKENKMHPGFKAMHHITSFFWCDQSDKPRQPGRFSDVAAWVQQFIGCPCALEFHRNVDYSLRAGLETEVVRNCLCETS